MTTLVAYNRDRATEMLRCYTPQRLLDEVKSGHIGTTLNRNEIDELTTLLQDWVQRALGLVTLRDALWVDTRRGPRVYDLLCTMLTAAACQVPHELASSDALPDNVALTPQQVRDAFGSSGGVALHHCEQLEGLLDCAEAEGLVLTRSDGTTPRYPFPDNLDSLLLPSPVPYTESAIRFEQPAGWRRGLAILLVVLGVASLGIPLLLGTMLAQPAGLPLGLLTLGLLVGIRAGWPGYIGALCIWLVPNLPTFHYSSNLTALWSDIPLLVVGMALLACDRHVRAMWRWIVRRSER